jgi:hypothetical protein
MKPIAFLVATLAVWASLVLPASAAFFCDQMDEFDCVDPGGHTQSVSPPPPTHPVGQPFPDSNVYLLCLPFVDENGSKGHRCAAFTNGAPPALPQGPRFPVRDFSTTTTGNASAPTPTPREDASSTGATERLLVTPLSLEA